MRPSSSPAATARRLRAALAFAAVLVALAAPGLAQAQTTYHVDAAAGSDAADGTTWATAFRTLRQALSVATGADEVWIAEGTYYPDEGPGATPDDSAASFVLTGRQDGLRVYGGFQSGDAFADRDPAAHPVVLSGDLTQDDFPAGPDLDSDGNPRTPSLGDHFQGTNSLHVVFLDGTQGAGGLTEATVLDGLTIAGGFAGGTTGVDDNGGGLVCLATETNSLRTSVCSPTLRGVTFANNSANGDGGGLYAGGRDGDVSSPVLRGCTFVGNVARGGLGKGGGLFADGAAGTSRPVVVGTVFDRNGASYRGGGAYVNGGGVSGVRGRSDVRFINTLFVGNTSGLDGGAVFSFGSGGQASVRFTNSALVGNAADASGGAVYAWARFGGFASTQFDNSIVRGNVADADADNTGEGSALFNDEAFASMEHTFVEGGPNGSGVAGTRAVNDRGGNSAADPLFADAADPAGPDGAFGTADDGLRLQPASPALDAGLNILYNPALADGVTTDLAGAERVQGGAIDVGAYERAVTPTTYFVDGAVGNDAAAGTTWATAFRTLRQALSAAQGGDAVWIAEGTYRPDDGPGATPGDRAASFTITQNDLQLYGGFQNGDAFADRSPADHPVVLSGDLGTPGVASDNSLHVVLFDGTATLNGVGPTTVLDGVTVTDGNADGAGDDANGGGLYCDGRAGACNPTLTALVVTGNAAASDGGGLFVNGGGSSGATRGSAAPLVTRSVFAGNTAGRAGGAIYVFANGDNEGTTVVSSLFADNGAHHLGYDDGNGGSEPRIVNCTFTGATTATVFVDPLDNEAGPLTFTNVVVWDDAGDLATDDAGLTVATSIVDEAARAGTGGVVVADPLFADASRPAGLDGVYGTADDGLRLLDGSPAFEAGDASALPPEAPPTDLTGAARVQGVAVDLGAYEVANQAVVFHVDGAAGSDAADGRTWTTAFATLDRALALAGGDDQVWIAEGTYVPTTRRDPANPRSATFTLDGSRDGLRVYGGFQNGDAFADRSPAEHPVVLSADLDGDDRPFDPTTDSDGNGSTRPQADHVVGANAYHVVFVDGATNAPVTRATVLDGVTLTSGVADDFGEAFQGAGVFCSGNGAGSTCSPTLANLVFLGHRALGDGGAISNRGDTNGLSSPALVNVVFYGNVASRGAGIFNAATSGGTSSPLVANAVFVNNVAAVSGSALFNSGPDGGTSSPTIVNVTATGNNAQSSGATISSLGADGASTPLIANVVVAGNTLTASGTEIANNRATPIVRNSLVAGSGGSGAGWNVAYGTDGGGNLDAVPAFLDAATPAGADGAFATPDDGLRLTLASPGLDAGANAALPADVADLDGDGDVLEDLPLDLARAVRRQDLGSGNFVVDLGAYEAAGTPLPVDLAAFTATADGQTVALAWQTLTETQNAGFAVEQRDEEEGSWREVAFVAGAGTTTAPQAYRHTLAHVPYGRHAFRLRQVDFDGTATPSAAVEVAVGLAAPYALAAYPNPVARSATIDVTAREAQRVTVAVYDVLGRRVATLFDGEVAASTTERLALPAHGLASGLYVVRATGERFSATQRLTVVR